MAPSSQPVLTVSSVGACPPSYPGPAAGEDELISRMVEHWRDQIAVVLPDEPDLIVLPELFDRYDQMPLEANLALRGAMGPATAEMLADLAREHGCHIAYGAAVPDQQSWHNSAVLIDGRGSQLARYDKLRLVPTEFDHELSPGNEPVVVDTDFGRIGFVLCFDLNFTELIDAYRPLHPDIMLFPSRYHGGLMQPYWAYQLRSHFITSVGITNLSSDVWSPVGQRLASSTNYQDHLTTTINTNCAVVHLDGNRAGPLQRLKRDLGRDVTITDPGELGSVLVTSNRPEVSVTELITSYQIEPLDDYLARSRSVNGG